MTSKIAPSAETNLKNLSSSALLQQGVNYARQECWELAVSFFEQARLQLDSAQPEIVEALNRLITDYRSYRQAQQALLLASQTITHALEEQRAHLQNLQNLLPALQTKDLPKPRLFFLASPSDRAVFETTEELLQLEGGSASLPLLYLTCFGHFEVRRGGQFLELCSNRNGQAVLRYLMAHEKQRASIDALMSVLWPEDPALVARHKLQIAVSALRRSLTEGLSLPGEGYILCKNEAYQLNPQVEIRSDADDFLKWYQLGQQTGLPEAITSYEEACRLYTGPFLVEDLYADWSSLRREQLTQIYLFMCNVLAEHYLAAKAYNVAATWAAAILAENEADETAHCQLMRAYAGQGRRSEVMHQFQRCHQILAEQLGVEPMPQTLKLFQTILTGQNY